MEFADLKGRWVLSEGFALLPVSLRVLPQMSEATLLKTEWAQARFRTAGGFFFSRIGFRYLPVYEFLT
jgi:hypothetical protein